MNVRQMIEELSKYSDDTKVIFRDSENGMVTVGAVTNVYLADNTQRVIISEYELDLP